MTPNFTQIPALEAQPGRRVALIRFLWCCFLLSPILDWFSYVLNRLGQPVTPATLLRGLLLLAVVVLGFLAERSNRVRLHMLGVCALAGGFWLLHIVLCILCGQTGFAQDLNNYLKFVQLPLFVYFFYRLQSRIRSAFAAFLGACLFNFWLILLADGLAWLTGTAEATYAVFSMGLLGWYYLANAQGIILSLLFPIALFVWLEPEGIWGAFPAAWKPKDPRCSKVVSAAFFLLTAVAGSLRLFYFGTRVSFACLLGTLILLIVLFLAIRRRRGIFQAMLLALCLAASLLWIRESPMVQLRLSDSQYAETVQEDLEKQYPSLKRLKTATGQTVFNVEELRPLYETYVPDLVRKFGLEEVVRVYDHSADFLRLRNIREKKIQFAELQMQRSPVFLRVVGFNFNQMILPGVEGSYDLESDWQALYYYNGLLGLSLFALFALALLILFIRALIRSRGRIVCDPRLWLLGYLSVMLVVAAAVSGSVFRRPSVSIYFAFILAALVQQLARSIRNS